MGGRGVGSIYLSSFCLPGFLVGEGGGLTEGACSCVRRDMAGYDTFLEEGSSRNLSQW